MNLRESKTLEYKETTNTNSFLKTISAYANYGGGQVIFGIADNGTIVGVHSPETACLDLENKINDSIQPTPRYSLAIQDDSTICLTVYEGDFKPYLFKGKAYKRIDTATVPVDRLEYNRLVLLGVNLSFEELPSAQQDLNFHSLASAFTDAMDINEWRLDILKTLELYSDKNGYNNAAALLADENTFPGIDIIRFGDDINEIMERETIAHVSLLTQRARSITFYRKHYQYEKITGSERTCIDKVPEKAFREAISNALVHRTWDVNASIKISMHPDKIAISSPGGLPAGISEEEYLRGQLSIMRNPIIGNVFFRLRYIEKFGTGILRINNAYASAIEKPSYVISENAITVVLPVISSFSRLSDIERNLLRLLQEQGPMHRAELENALGESKSRIIRSLNDLLEKDLIRRAGAGRGTTYIAR